MIVPPHPERASRRGQSPKDRGRGSSHCNPFLVFRSGGSEPPPPAQRRRRRKPSPEFLYGVLDQAEILDEGRVALVFGAVAGDWLREIIISLGLRGPPGGDDSTAFYARMPLYLLEVALSQEEVMGMVADPAAPRKSVQEAIEELEGIWVRIGLSADGPNALLFDNLFGPADEVGFGSVRRAPRLASTFLDKLDPLDPKAGIPDATFEEIEGALQPLSRIDEVAVYDVGQGGANGLVVDGQVACYFDFGGGCAGHTFTFPKMLSSFCLCKKPPIILSHWDHDHWSSEGRDLRAHALTWIAPRQFRKSLKRAPHHSALVKAIQAAGGRILLWNPKWGPKTFGALTISLCTGSSKNASGLALEVRPPADRFGLPVLLPADAGYDDLCARPARGQYDAIVCPHHGGKSAWTTIPSPPSGSYQRLIYTYGPGNKYNHPLKFTYTEHHKAKWVDGRLSAAGSASLVRNTADRSHPQTPAHVGFDWTTNPPPLALICGSDLTVTQK